MAVTSEPQDFQLNLLYFWLMVMLVFLVYKIRVILDFAVVHSDKVDRSLRIFMLNL